MIKTLFAALLALGIAACPARAQNCGPLPNTLTNGQPADANQLMANFNYMLNCVNAGREVLTASRIYYVRTDGADSNNGLTNSAAGAFFTWQHAVNVVHEGLNLNGNTVTIQAGGSSGTFTGGISVIGPFVGAQTLESVQLRGNPDAPSNFVLQTTTTTSVVAADAGAFFAINGFELKSTGGGYLIDNRRNSVIRVNGEMIYDLAGGDL